MSSPTSPSEHEAPPPPLLREGLTPRRFDWLTEFAIPACIVGLLMSLLYYLLEVREAVGGRDIALHWVAFWFILAVVGISRIRTKYGEAVVAIPYTIGLGLVMVLFICYYTTFGGAFVGGGPNASPALALMFNLGLIAFVWWAGSKLTRECTLEDQVVAAGEQGMLQQPGHDGPDTPRGGPTRHPGWLVLWFTLGALVLFALCQRILIATWGHGTRHAFHCMVAYTFFSLALLGLTSLSALRLHAFRRKLRLDKKLSVAWVIAVIGLAGLLLTAAALLPRTIDRAMVTRALAQLPEWVRDHDPRQGWQGPDQGARQPPEASRREGEAEGPPSQGRGESPGEGPGGAGERGGERTEYSKGSGKELLPAPEPMEEPISLPGKAPGRGHAGTPGKEPLSPSPPEPGQEGRGQPADSAEGTSAGHTGSQAASGGKEGSEQQEGASREAQRSGQGGRETQDTGGSSGKAEHEGTGGAKPGAAPAGPQASDQGEGKQGAESQGNSGAGKDEHGSSGGQEGGAGEQAGGASSEGESGGKQGSEEQGKSGGQGGGGAGNGDQAGAPKAGGGPKQGQEEQQGEKQRQRAQGTAAGAGAESRPGAQPPPSGSTRPEHHSPRVPPDLWRLLLLLLLFLALLLLIAIVIALIVLLVRWIRQCRLKGLRLNLAGYWAYARDAWRQWWAATKARWRAFVARLAAWWAWLLSRRRRPATGELPEDRFADIFGDRRLTDSLSPAQIVTHVYEAFLAYADLVGKPRAEHQTPLEYLRRLPTDLQISPEDARRLTLCYVQAAYTPHEVSQRQVETVRGIWERLQEPIDQALHDHRTAAKQVRRRKREAA